jgi:hypothetical protein
VHEFVIPVALGVAVAFAWMAIWISASRLLFGIPVFMRNPEECATRRQRILQIGKLRYILTSGLLGNGFAMGLGIAAAIMMSHHLMSHHSVNWSEGVVIFGVIAVLGGGFHGLRTWNELFRVEVPFPPVYPPPR